MSVIHLESALANATAVFSSKNKQFLNSHLEPVNDVTQKARIGEIICNIQSQHWNLSSEKSFENCRRLSVLLGLLYRDDPNGQKLTTLFLGSINAIRDPASHKAYTRKLQHQLSLLHFGKSFFKAVYEEAVQGMKSVEIQKRRDRLGIILIPDRGPQRKDRITGKCTTYFSMEEVEGLKTVEGIAFLAEHLPAIWDDSRSQLYTSSFSREKLGQAVQSENSDVSRVAEILLTICDIRDDPLQATPIIEEFAKFVNLAKPLLADKAFTLFFPSIDRFVRHVQAYYDEQRDKQLKGTYSEDFDHSEYEERLEILKEMEKEVRDSESLYRYLSDSWNHMKDLSSNKLKFYQAFASSTILDGNRLPFINDYLDLNSQEAKRNRGFEKKEEKKVVVAMRKSSKGAAAAAPKSRKSYAPSRAVSAVVTKAPSSDKPSPFYVKRIESMLLRYVRHVTDWFEFPAKALKEHGQEKLPLEVQSKITLFHAFPVIVDDFVGTNYCLKEICENSRTGQVDHLYAIPAEFDVGGVTYRGFFQYIIDSKTGVCYHRCFTDRSKEFADDLIQQKIWKPADFPTLAQAHQKSKPKTIETGVYKLVVDTALGIVQMRVEGANVRIFRIGGEVSPKDEGAESFSK